MRKIYFLLLLISFISFTTYSQNSTCFGAAPFCAGGSTLTFPNVTGIASSGSLGCLSSTPNPAAWFYFQIGASGNFNFILTQGNNPPAYNNLDVDFICWGPFASATCTGLYDYPDGNTAIPNNIVACSYSAAATENFSINGAVAGQVYMIMITNFSNQPGQITLTQTNIGQPGGGATNCDIMCPLSLNGGGTFCEGTIATLVTTINGLSTPAAYAGASFTWTSTAPGFVPPPTNVGVINVNVPGTYTVVVNKPGCTSNITASATYALVPPPNIGIPITLTNCEPNTIFNLAVNTPIIRNGISGLFIDYHTTLLSANDGSAGFNIIGNPAAYVSPGPFPQTIFVSVEDNFNSCITITSFELHSSSSATPTLSVDVVNNTVTVTAIGSGIYLYSLDGGAYQQSPIFQNVPMGTHTVAVISSFGCGMASVSFTVVTPFAPIAVSPQYFNQGATLANMVVYGQNIQWYASANNKNNLPQVTSVPLPLSTVLVDGQVYHASQTINGIESATRTPVMSLLTLSQPDNFFSNLSYFPNPVKNMIYITNDSVIDSFTLFSVLGQKIMTNKVNALNVEIDMVNISKGIYFLNLHCGGLEKNIKVIKE